MLSCPMEQNWVQLLLTVTVTVLSIHLTSYMLGYACINLILMINRFPDTAVRVAVDSLYINKKIYQRGE